jgi:hypothetical protein
MIVMKCIIHESKGQYYLPCLLASVANGSFWIKNQLKTEAVYHAQFVCYPNPDNNLLKLRKAHAVST